MTTRFPLYTDADIKGALVDALILRGWDVLRAVDAFPEGTLDDVHFEHAAKLGRVLVAHDADQRRLAGEWLQAGKHFSGFVTWEQTLHQRIRIGRFLAAFEKLAEEHDPFANNKVLYLQVDVE